MVRVDPQSVRITFPGPTPGTGRVNSAAGFDGFVMPMLDRPFIAQGRATLTGSVGESAANWRFGFIQMIWVHTWWAHYKGRERNEGSIFINYRNAERLTGSAHLPPVLRDTADNNPNRFWINDDLAPGARPTARYLEVVPSTATVPYAVGPVDFDDQPQIPAVFMLTNDKTSRANFLVEAQIELNFCTIFSAMENPSGLFKHLAHFFWSVRWQGRFGGGLPFWEFLGTVPGTTGFSRSHVIPGPPGNVRILNRITQPFTESFLVITRRALHEAHLPVSPAWHSSTARDHHYDVHR